MTWEVEGLDRDKQSTICFTVEAETREDARKAALAKRNCIIKDLRHVLTAAVPRPVFLRESESQAATGIWDVDCINANTGRSRTLTIHAPSAEEAANIVRKKGWPVLRVKAGQPTLLPAEDPIRCPKCGSEQIGQTTRGFRVKGAAIGIALLGPVGVVGGFAGSQKLKLQCLRCSHCWTPGECR